MIVRVPEEDAARIAAMRCVGGGRLVAVRQDVMPADRIVAAIEDVALPFADERALRRAGLIAGIGVDRARALRRPADDLDRARRRIVDAPAVSFERRWRRVDDRHRDPAQIRREGRDSGSP